MSLYPVCLIGLIVLVADMSIFTPLKGLLGRSGLSRKDLALSAIVRLVLGVFP